MSTFLWTHSEMVSGMRFQLNLKFLVRSWHIRIKIFFAGCRLYPFDKLCFHSPHDYDGLRWTRHKTSDCAVVACKDPILSFSSVWKGMFQIESANLSLLDGSRNSTYHRNPFLNT